MINNVTLTGRITKDLELRYNQNKLEVLNFNIANDRGYGEKKKTNFISCVAFGKTAVAIDKYCKKGNLIGIVGEVSTSVYETKDGDKRVNTNIVINQVEFLTSKPKEENNAIVEENDPYKEFGEEHYFDAEDLPF